MRIEPEPDLALPYLVASFGSEADIRRYGARSIMLKVAFVLWASAPTYTELHAALDGRTDLVAPHRDERFAFWFTSINCTIAQDRKREIVDGFAYLSMGADGLRGPIDLRDPQLEIGVFEYHAAGPAHLQPDGITLRRVFVGRKVRSLSYLSSPRAQPRMRGGIGIAFHSDRADLAPRSASASVPSSTPSISRSAPTSATRPCPPRRAC